MPIFGICGIAALVFGAIVYSVAANRPSAALPGAKARLNSREVIWASIPILIVIAAATPALKNMNNARVAAPPVYAATNPVRVCGIPAAKPIDANAKLAPAPPCATHR